MSQGSIRARGKGAWELKYDVGHDPVTGRRMTKYATVRGAKRDAQKELRRRLNAVDQGRHADPGKMTVGDLLKRWLEEAQSSVSPKTIERYREIVQRHLIPALGMIPLAKLQPVHIQAYYATALTDGRLDRKGGLSPKTVLHHDRVLALALKRARGLRLMAGNPMEGVKRPKEPEREIEVPEPWEMSELLKVAKPTRLYVPIFLALATGLRRGELLALHWKNVDLGRGSLTVTQALEQTRKGLRFKEPKTKRSRRTIALSPAVVEILQEHKVAQLEERMKLGLGKNESGLVFTNLDGTVVNPLSLTQQFANLVKRAGITKVTFHGLRHAHFTNLLSEGVHPKVASERAGHASVAITMDLYSHVIPGLQEEAALRIDAALRKVLRG